MGWVSYSGIVESVSRDIDTPATELQLSCFPDTWKLKQVSQCHSLSLLIGKMGIIRPRTLVLYIKLLSPAPGT